MSDPVDVSHCMSVEVDSTFASSSIDDHTFVWWTRLEQLAISYHLSMKLYTQPILLRNLSALVFESFLHITIKLVVTPHLGVLFVLNRFQFSIVFSRVEQIEPYSKLV